MSTDLKRYDAYGTWTVTTEGDVEGRTTRNLGTFTGFLDEIAFHLAHKCYYSLKFKPAEEVKEFVPKKHKVNVMLDIESGTWDSKLGSDGRIQYFEKMLQKRPVFVESGTTFASVTLVNTAFTEEDKARQAALSKLTDREKELLGLK